MSKKKQSVNKKQASKSKTVEPEKSKQVAEGVYVIDNKKEEEKLSKDYTRFYTTLGLHHKLVDGFPVVFDPVDGDQGTTVYAKEVSKSGKVTHYIRTNNDGFLYNPLAINQPQTFKAKLLGQNEFVKVGEKCFKFYLEFLKTKNVLHYKFAEQNKQ